MKRSFGKKGQWFHGLWVLLLLAPGYCMAQQGAQSRETVAGVRLEAGFQSPPDSVKPWMYWYWINDNISKKGIRKDLETMAKVGVGEAFIGNIGMSGEPRGKVPMFSPAWWNLTKYAVHEGAVTGVHIGFFNGPGWSQSGGPWVKPGEAMRYLVSKDWKVKGEQKIVQRLDMPYKHFQGVEVLAFPVPKEDDASLSGDMAVISCSPHIPGVAKFFDGDTVTAADLPVSDKPVIIEMKVKTAFTARSLSLYPAKEPFSALCELQAYDSGAWHTVRKFLSDRSNDNLNVGPMPYGPVTVAFPATSSLRFRLIFSAVHGKAGFTEIQLSPAARLGRYVEKQLGKMFQKPHPMWDAYRWPSQEEPDDKALVVDRARIMNITKSLSPDGTLTWSVPKGDWIIERIGMVPTGVVNAPADPEGRGLEVDKMNTKALTAHFNAYIGRILDSIAPADRRAFRHVVADSYETGSEDWTDGFRDDFEQRYGYDPLPWLPVLSGRIVGSADRSNRFLWDLRRLIASEIAYKYVGGLRKLSEAHGLRVWLENYGHWGFPSEFLMYGGQSDDIAGEFWAEGDLGSIELRDASSAAHIYGKKEVWAESFTAAGKAFLRYPAMLKQRGDWAFTEGVNHTLLHVYIEQPYDSMPGMNAWFGTEFNRHNTWFSHAKVWIDYLRRCMFMLQRGKPVEDVCYFIGEDAPKMTGIQDPPLPKGYSFDYINAEVIEKRLSVKHGRLVLPDGISYRLMVLPPETTMRPELLKKIRMLVAAGATILGEPPACSPSLQHFSYADGEVKKIAAELWQNCDGKAVRSVRYGKGMVLRGMDMQTALAKLKEGPDVKFRHGMPLVYVHRRMADADIYFLTNQSDSVLRVTPEFRVAGMQPELWNAVTGAIRPLPDFREEKGGIVVPLKFFPYQSWFVVFRKHAGRQRSGDAANFPGVRSVKRITGPWTVTFDHAMRGPQHSVVFDSLKDWSKCPQDSIRYYSGSATYSKTFTLDRLPHGGQLFLDLGKVRVMAHVKLNGKEIGGAWTAPWRVNITGALRQGENKLEISVVNLWVNRLIGDSRLPQDERRTWAPVDPYKPGSSLQPSGLMGPVTIQAINSKN